MKSVVCAAVLSLGASAFAAPAAACDFHGAGAFPGGFGARWTPYDPGTPYDPAAYKDSFSDYTPKDEATPQTTRVEHEDEKAANRPSFSNVASLASRKARDRVNGKSDAKSEKPVRKQADLKTDR
ncbi:MAG: hypothetical protein GDA35_03755 [Hyphomonadaceae bacterium]|nr:hypothetical protein [Hyphomonadaceae bacterium]